ncbi:MAG: hypothetical protein WCS28_02430 [Thiomicrospira sp.]|jgi:hypothetical protein
MGSDLLSYSNTTIGIQKHPLDSYHQAGTFGQYCTAISESVKIVKSTLCGVRLFEIEKGTAQWKSLQNFAKKCKKPLLFQCGLKARKSVNPSKDASTLSS